MQPSANKQAVKIMKHNIKKSWKKNKKSRHLLLYAYHKIWFVAVAVDEVKIFKRGEANRTNQLLHT